MGRQRSNAWTRPRIKKISQTRSPAEQHFAKTPGFYELVAPTSPRLSNDQFPVPTQYSQPIASTTTADSGPAHCGCDDSSDRRRQSQQNIKPGVEISTGPCLRCAETETFVPIARWGSDNNCQLRATTTTRPDQSTINNHQAHQIELQEFRPHDRTEGPRRPNQLHMLASLCVAAFNLCDISERNMDYG